MASVQHSFVQGVRFDTEVKYRVFSGGRSRYCKLPIKAPEGEGGDGHLMSLCQCVALLCHMPFRQVCTALHTDQGGDGDKHYTEAFEVLGCHCRDEVNQGQASYMAIAALRAIRAGQVCRVQFASEAYSRWAMVIGVEWELGSDQVRALLLLDPNASEPWACGHNARIELRRANVQAVRGSPTFCLNYRCLTGEVSAVRLQRLITLCLDCKQTKVK